MQSAVDGTPISVLDVEGGWYATLRVPRTRSELEELGNALLEPVFPVAKGVRLLGVSLSSLAVEEAEREPEFSLPA